MFKHILVPTDGSEHSGRAIEHAIRLAKFHGARISGLYVIPERHNAIGYGELAGMTGDAEENAKRFLAVIADAARAAGVPCECFIVHGESASEEIVNAAAQRGCDLIHMASHGRTGLAGLLLGSETARVLQSSKIPVFVYR